MRFRPVFWFALLSVGFAILAFARASVAAPAVVTLFHRAELGLQQAADKQTVNLQAGAGSKDSAWTIWSTLPDALRAKVDPRILAELKGDVTPAHLSRFPTLPTAPAQPLAQTRFLVYLRDQANLTALQTNVYASQADRRQAMFDTLVNTAQSAQAGVKAVLDVQIAQKDVNTYQAFYLVNAMAVEGSLSTLIALVPRDDVARVVANYPLISFATQTGTPSRQQPAGSAVQPAQAQAPQLSADNWNISLVGADRVWDELGVTGQGAVVAGFDTGVNYTHPALVKHYRGNLGNGQFNHNYNWFEPDSNLYKDGNLGPSVSTQPYDCSGHGTHTMGTAVGDGGGLGTQIGMAPGAQWIAVPGICYSTMPGGIDDEIGALKAFQWLFCPTDLTGNLATADCSKAPDVVNDSWGSANPTDSVLRPAIQRLRKAGIAPVFAAGNPDAGPGSIGTPANAPEAITVGAIDSFDKVADFSGRGPAFYEGVQKPQLTAPGVYVLSSIPGGAYVEASGTSMAAPHVTGLIALMVAADLKDGVRDLNVDELESFMNYTAVDLGKPGPDDDYGYGRINAYEAVRWVLSSGDLRGKVRDANSNVAIATALVKGLNANPNNNFHASTNSSGAYSITVPAGAYNVQVEAWGYYSATFLQQTVFPNALSVADFALKPLPTATLNGVVRSGDTPVGNALIYVEKLPSVNVHSNADGSYQLNLPVGVHEIAVRTPGQRVLHTQVNISSNVTQDLVLQSAPSILFVDADAQGGWFYGWSNLSIFQWALDRQNYQYDVWPIEYTDITGTKTLADGSTGYGIPPLTTLEQYNLVIWAHHGCGYGCYLGGTPAVMGADKLLTHYLDHGGRLVLSGQDIGRDSGSALFDHYLHATYQLDRAATEGDTLAGSNFLQGLTLTVTNASLYGYANGYITLAPDGVGPTPDDGAAYPLLTYDNSNSSAALAVEPCDAPYRAVYFAVGYENIGPRASVRSPAIAETLGRSINWAMGQKAAYSLALSAKPVTLSGEPGSRITYRLQIMNTGLNPAAVQLNVQGNQWPSQLLDANGNPLVQPFALAPCHAQTVTLAATIPATARTGAQDKLTVAATLVENPAAGQTVTLTTAAFAAWRSEPPLLTSRFALGAAALPDTASIYVMGGIQRDYTGDYYNYTFLAANERYDACTQRWEKRAPLPVALSDFGAAELNGKVYIVGGLAQQVDSGFATYVATDQVYAYDPANNRWSPVAALPAPYINMAVAAANGKLYAFGGSNAGFTSDKTYVYDPGQNRWQAKSVLPHGANAFLAAATLGGKIYLLSGGGLHTLLDIYDPGADTWTQATGLDETNAVNALGLAASPDGFLYATGVGDGGSNATLVERYDPQADRWTKVAKANLRADYTNATIYAGGRIFIMGGEPGDTNIALAVTNSFCLASKSAQQATVAPGGRITYTLTLHPDLVDLPNAQVLDPLPLNTTFAGFGVNNPGATYNAAQRRVEWQGALPANQALTQFSYAVNVAESGVKVGDVITTTTLFASGAGLRFTRSISTTVVKLDLSSSTKTVDQAEALGGRVLTYTIDIRGQNTASGPVTVRDPLPPTVEYVPDSLTFTDGAGQYDPATRTIIWNGLLHAGQDSYLNTQSDYIWGDSEGNGFVPAVPFQWRDIRHTGTNLPGGDDVVACDLPIGFDFPFYGEIQKTFCVSSNGFISFAAKGSSRFRNDCPLPEPSNSGITPLIAAFWDDLVIEDGMTYQTFGLAPNRYLIVQWNQARSFSTTAEKKANFQLILAEDGVIKVQVLNADGAQGGSATIGIENQGGSRGLTYACNRTDAIHERWAGVFVPPGAGIGAVAANVRFQVTSAPNLGVNTWLTNTATIATAATTFQRSAVTLLNSVDLSHSSLQLDKAEVNVGEQVSYRLALRNTGVLTASQAALTLPLPNVTTYVQNSLLCDSGQCTVDGNVVHWTGQLSPVGTVNLQVAAQLTTPLHDRTPVTSTAQLADGFGNFYPFSSIFLARRADLSGSTMQIIPPYADPGATVSVAVFVRNTGSLTTTGEVQTPIPTGLLYVTGSLTCSTGVCSDANGGVIWRGTVAPRSVAQVRFQVTVPASANYGDRFTANAQIKDATWGDEYPVTATLWIAHSTFMPSVFTLGGRYYLYLPFASQ
ncbi:MAG: S8 family serine peptidase [Caldilineaceae bacterium]